MLSHSSHVATRDRLRASNGLKTLATRQRFSEGFEALQALYRGHVLPNRLIPEKVLTAATPHQHGRAVVPALHALGTRLTRAA